MKKNNIKKVSMVVLFSSMLSVGIGMSSVVGSTVVNAEELSIGNTIPSGQYESSVKNIFMSNTQTKKTGNYITYRPAIQNINTKNATTLSLNDPIFNEENGRIKISRMSFVMRNEFKKGDKIKVEYKTSDPLKQSKIHSFAQEGEVKKIELTIMKNSNFMFFDNDSSLDIAYPDKVKLTTNEDGSEIYYEFELTVPNDSPFMSTDYSPTILGIRNDLTKDSRSYSVIENELKEKDVVVVGSTDVKVYKGTENKLMSQFILMKLDAVKDNRTAAKKNNQLYADLNFPERFNEESLVPFISNDKSNVQDIKANILNGGITGGLVNPEVGQDLSIKDVDFGRLSIGQMIEPIKEDKMVSVRDWTGGNGWKLTAQHKNADRNQSLQLGVQVNDNTKVDLSDEAQPVTSGESQLEVTTQGGEYTAKWGTHPKAGEFNNVIEWNLTANVTE